MFNEITVGLDFGTHQTKVCVRTKPDEGHGQEKFEFFRFPKDKGGSVYCLPSIVQLNSDGTLSYGFVDPSEEMPRGGAKPEKAEADSELLFDVKQTAIELCRKYGSSGSEEDMMALSRMLEKRQSIIKIRNKGKQEAAECRRERAMRQNNASRNVWRYFKQTAFSEHTWDGPIPSATLSVWYLAYVLFLLEERYGTQFHINMGIPTGDSTYMEEKRKGVRLLTAAYRIVEDVYAGDMQAFLDEKAEKLLQKTEIPPYSESLIDDYYIEVFPEAYASLVSLTSRGKIGFGMCVAVDIGGGTTDMSFFSVRAGAKRPTIYKYWSLPYGLNYIAELSGLAFETGGSMGKDFKKSAVDKFNNEKRRVVDDFITHLETMLVSYDVTRQRLRDALCSRPLVYAGGGSCYPWLTGEIHTFTDIKRLQASDIWNEENIADMEHVAPLCPILATSYGLSVCEISEDVVVAPMHELFNNLPRKGQRVSRYSEDNYIGKEQC